MTLALMMMGYENITHACEIQVEMTSTREDGLSLALMTMGCEILNNCQMASIPVENRVEILCSGRKRICVCVCL